MTKQNTDATPASAKKVGGSNTKRRTLKPVEVPIEAYDIPAFCAAMHWSEGLFHKVKRAGKIATFKVGDKPFVSRDEMERIKREGVDFSPAKAASDGEAA